MDEKILFVGGPWHGRIKEINSKDYSFHVKEKIPIPLEQPSTELINERVTIYYRKKVIFDEIGFLTCMIAFNCQNRNNVLDAALRPEIKELIRRENES